MNYDELQVVLDRDMNLLKKNMRAEVRIVVARNSPDITEPGALDILTELIIQKTLAERSGRRSEDPSVN